MFELVIADGLQTKRSLNFPQLEIRDWNCLVLQSGFVDLFWHFVDLCCHLVDTKLVHNLALEKICEQVSYLCDPRYLLFFSHNGVGWCCSMSEMVRFTAKPLCKMNFDWAGSKDSASFQGRGREPWYSIRKYSKAVKLD